MNLEPEYGASNVTFDVEELFRSWFGLQFTLHHDYSGSKELCRVYT